MIYYNIKIHRMARSKMQNKRDTYEIVYFILGFPSCLQPNFLIETLAFGVINILVE